MGAAEMLAALGCVTTQFTREHPPRIYLESFCTSWTFQYS